MRPREKCAPDAPRKAAWPLPPHPELTGTYLNLRAAEFASRALRDPQDQRRFVAQIRRGLAQDIERGEPLQPVGLRERPERKLMQEQVR